MLCPYLSTGRGAGDLPTDPQLSFLLPAKSFDNISTSKEIRNLSRRQPLGKLWLQKTSGNHGPRAGRGTNLGGSEEQWNITRSLEVIYPEPGHGPGKASESLGSSSFCSCRQQGPGKGPTSGWLQV